jgi:glycosyltransferase involved in cell wall biosynthesis
MIERVSTTRVVEPTLSVVLPNYNHARYLPRALDALLSQDCLADEIIVVDDCSTDNSRNIIETYAARYSSVRLLANAKNMGVIAALLRGLNEARGQYVYFGAADDFVMPGFFATAIKTMHANPQAGLFCGEAMLVDGQSGEILGTRPPVRPRFRAGFIHPARVAKLLRGIDNFVQTGAAVFRRDAVAWAGGFDERLSSFADGYIARKVALTYGFCYAPRVFLTWFIFPDSVSRKTATETDRARKILDTILTQMAADPVFPAWYPELFARRWRFSTSRLAVESKPVNRALLLELGAPHAIDRVVFGFALNMTNKRIARFIMLAWLWLRFRPFSLIGLVSTALSRLVDRL